MCILFIYVDPAPKKNGYRLIIASNRDEYYRRPAQSAFLCPDHNTIAGLDMEPGREGGMWLGVCLNKTDSYKFRFGALLNITGEDRKHAVIGRGPIVCNYLTKEISAEEYVRKLQSSAEDYNAFNFVAVELSETDTSVYHQSNAPNVCSTYRGKQVLGFGNSTTAIPLLKVNKGADRFATIVESYGDLEQRELLVNELLKLLRWEERHLPDPELKWRAPQGFEFLSAVFVKILPMGYGTRTHSIVLIDYDWHVDFMEVTMEALGDPKNPTWQTKDIKAQL